MKESNNQKKNKCKAEQVNLLDLSYEERTVIWSLRMCLSDQKKRVRAEFNRAMPSAVARIATGSVSGFIDGVRYHGKKSLLFNCMCKECLSEDEKRVVSLFQAITDSDVSRIHRSAEVLVRDEGIEKIIDAATGFLFALRIKDVGELCDVSGGLRQAEEMKSTSIH